MNAEQDPGPGSPGPRSPDAPSAQIQIRAALPADASDLAAFAARTFVETFGADNRPEDLRAHLAASFGIPQQTREIIDPNVTTLLAHQDQVLIAFAQIGRRPPPPCVTVESPVELQRFYVDRPGHGRGIAQNLMQAAQQAARDFGGRHLWLGVWERNPRAIAFYTKAGFTDQGSHDFFVGSDRQTDRVLVAPLYPARAA